MKTSFMMMLTTKDGDEVTVELAPEGHRASLMISTKAGSVAVALLELVDVEYVAAALVAIKRSVERR